MPEAVIILGPNTGWFRDSVVRQARGYASVVSAEHKRFPDGESYVRVPLDELRGARVLIVQSLGEPQDTSLWQLFLLVDAANRMGASRIGVYAPYLAYSRQDKVFLPGEPVSIEVLLRSLAGLGASALFTIDIHNPDSLKSFPGESRNVFAFRPLVERLRERLGSEPLVLAPDKGAVHRARHVAGILGAEHDYLEKRRDRVTGDITIAPKRLSARGRSVVIVDDIISTGGTVAKAASMLLEQGAEEVFVAVSHALMAGNAREKLEKAGVSRVYSLNTLPPRPWVEYVDATPEAFETLSEFLAR